MTTPIRADDHALDLKEAKALNLWAFKVALRLAPKIRDALDLSQPNPGLSVILKTIVGPTGISITGAGLGAGLSREQREEVIGLLQEDLTNLGAALRTLSVSERRIERAKDGLRALEDSEKELP